MAPSEVRSSSFLFRCCGSLTGLCSFLDNNVIEKLLVQGGLRLAATLNAIFPEPDDDMQQRQARGPINLDWLNLADQA